MSSAGGTVVAKDAALRCDELAAGSGGSGSVAWRAAASIADAACVDLTPPPRCRWPKIFAHDASRAAGDGRGDAQTGRERRSDGLRGFSRNRRDGAPTPGRVAPRAPPPGPARASFLPPFASRGERIEDAGDDSGDDPATRASVSMDVVVVVRDRDRRGTPTTRRPSMRSARRRRRRSSSWRRFASRRFGSITCPGTSTSRRCGRGTSARRSTWFPSAVSWFDFNR